MRLTTDEVRHVAELAKLRLTEQEVAAYADQLSAILDYAEHLLAVDTASVPPTPSVLSIHTVMAADQAEPGLSNAQALANAPDASEGFFRVRGVFE